MAGRGRSLGWVLRDDGRKREEGWTRENWPADSDFTPKKVEKMLRDAGAPEPWVHPEYIAETTGLAATLVWLAADKRAPAKPDPLAPKRKRAQDAVDELRRVLPALIAETEREAAANLVPAKWWTAKGDRFRQLRDAAAAAPAFIVKEKPVGVWTPKRRSPGEQWQDPARTLFDKYVLVVGRGSVGRNSNAVRFVVKALTIMGYKSMTPGAVYGVLYRYTYEDAKLRENPEPDKIGSHTEI